MSEQQVLPEFGWILDATVHDDGDYHCIKSAKGGHFESSDILPIFQQTLRQLAQSEVERERLQGELTRVREQWADTEIDRWTAAQGLAREREANQGLREVVKKYREEHEIHSGCDDEFGLCTICKQADASIEDKFKPVATTS